MKRDDWRDLALALVITALMCWPVGCAMNEAAKTHQSEDRRMIDTTKRDVQMAYLRCRTAERVLDEHDAKRPNLHSGITSEYTQWENRRDVLQREERSCFAGLMGILSVHLKDMAPPGPHSPPRRPNSQRDWA